MPNVLDIIALYLKLDGCDGLANADAECGCALDDLAPCGAIGHDCVPALKKNVDGETLFFAKKYPQIPRNIHINEESA